LEHVRVSEGDVILLYTGRWKRRAALGAWPRETDVPLCFGMTRRAGGRLDSVGPGLGIGG
jgi:hypothetical protein